MPLFRCKSQRWLTQLSLAKNAEIKVETFTLVWASTFFLRIWSALIRARFSIDLSKVFYWSEQGFLSIWARKDAETVTFYQRPLFGLEPMLWILLSAVYSAQFIEENLSINSSCKVVWENSQLLWPFGIAIGTFCTELIIWKWNWCILSFQSTILIILNIVIPPDN